MDVTLFKQVIDIGTCLGSVATAVGVLLAYRALKMQRQQLQAQYDQMKADQEANRLQRKVQYEQMKAEQEATRQQLQAQYRQMREEHEWNRRQFAGQMLSEWNEQILPHRIAIEAKFASGIDTNAPQEILSLVAARKIYGAKPANKEDWEMRFHLISLFNYFEFVAVAREHWVADEKLIDRSFKPTMIKYYEALGAFIGAVKDGRDIDDAWGPYVDLVKKWKQPSPPQGPTGT